MSDLNYDKPEVSIIIVNWNVRELLVKCVGSIFTQVKNLNFEIIVVDNGSNDNSIKALREIFTPQIKQGGLLIIDNKRNLGFAKANNQGLKQARGRYVLFMNPDMELIENSPLILKNFMDANPAAGICACTLVYADGAIQPTVKRFPTVSSQILILLKLHHLFQPPCLKKYLAKKFDYQKTAPVDQLMGAFIFTRKDLMNQLNGWSEDYFIWWEDVDLCRRVNNLGRPVIYAPLSKVIHYEGKSFEQQVSLKKQQRFIKGLLVYFKKYHSRPAYWLLVMLAPISLLLAGLAQILKIKPKTQSKI